MNDMEIVGRFMGDQVAVLHQRRDELEEQARSHRRTLEQIAVKLRDLDEALTAFDAAMRRLTSRK